MGESSRRQPEVAQYEEYDSDRGSVKPNTRVRAKAPVRSQSVVVNQRRSTVSDPRYSSRTGATTSRQQTFVVEQSIPRSSAPPSPTRARPVVQRSQNQARTQTVYRQQCTDPNCGDPNCQSARNTERRYTLPQQPAYGTQKSPTTPAPRNVPANTSQPRTRADSRSRAARPVSMYETMPPAYYAPPPARGPPPSPSAYQRGYFTGPYQQPYQPPPVFYGSTPPNQITPGFTPVSPVIPSPTSPNYNTGFSARQYTPQYTSYDTTKTAFQPPLTRTLSARQPAARSVVPPPESSESDSEASSYYESSADEREYRARQRDRERGDSRSKRDSKLMAPPPLRESRRESRRPPISTRYTTPVIHSRPSRSREPLRRAPRSDTAVDPQSSSDNFDSDRTTRAFVDRPRTDSSFSSHRRRPSISTNASSGTGRTKATTLSSGSGGRKVIVEDRYGRRTAYLSKEAQDDLVRRYQQQKLADQEQKEQIEAYQARLLGVRPVELTAENIRKASDRKSSGSQISAGERSKKSSRSGTKTNKTEGFKIISGDTVLEFSGEAKVEMHAGEDGAPNRIIVGGLPSSRDSAYHSGSKSSSSRVGRRRESIREEDGYEAAL